MSNAPIEDKNVPRTRQINLRVTDEEKQMIEDKVNANGFRTITQFLMWLVHNFKGNDNNKQ
jgi:uncharacterized protein (DUF1778 family)